MTTTEPTTGPLLDLLERERAHLLAAVARVPPALHDRRVAPTGWCAVEVVEHVARVDRGVARLLAAAQGGGLATDPAAAPIGAPLDAATVARLRDRGARLEAPERVRPAGGLTMPAALAALGEARAALLDGYRAATPAALYGASYPHPLLGPMTLHAWLELSAHHDARHAAQLDELVAALADAAG